MQSNKWQCDTNSVYGKTEETVVNLFVEAASRNPEAIAIIHENKSLTYQDLHEKTNKLACYLRSYGVKDEVFIPIFMEPSLEIIIAMLGIMKASAAYVPIDPNYPNERVAYMLKDIACNIILVSNATKEKLPLNSDCTIIVLEELWHTIEAETSSLSMFLSLPRPMYSAYIIYTSGSTGRPKGVVVEHDQLYKYICDAYQNLELHECNSYAILGTFSADAGLTAVFSALCFGKSLNIIDVKRFSSTESFNQYLNKYHIDCYKITPSLIEFYLQQNDGYKMLPAKRLILGGEACSIKLVKLLLEIIPEGCTIFNHYGPTETTIGVITYKIPTRAEDISNVIPLGKPLNNVRCFVLDECMIPVLNGNIGELYIEGPLLARGYLNNPELTNQKFIYISLNGEKMRLYKTGDLVRVLLEGNIEYLGRIDDQVKIRGHRIELKEIENAVLRTDMVKQCVIMAREDKSGSKYLAGYIVHNNSINKSTLLKLIRRELPEYMIPRRWVSLSELPLTFNNKVDKKSLPDPYEPIQIIANVDDDLERKLNVIWQDILGLKEIHSDENFFDLGGDSLLLIKLGFNINNLLKTNITSGEIFNNLTINKLTFLINTKKSITRFLDKNLTGFDEMEASVAQKNLYFQNKLNPSESFPNSSLTFEILGIIDLEKLESTITEIIRLNESLRTSYYFSKGTLYKKVINNVDFKLIYSHTKHDSIDQVINSLTKPFDFSSVPLIRVFIIEIYDSRKYMHIDLPHINSDGESMKIIMQNMETIYKNPNIKLTPLQFTDFQKKSYMYLNSARFRKDEIYWQNQLSNDIFALNFNQENSKVSTSRFDGIYVISQFNSPKLIDINNYTKGRSLTRFQLTLITYFLLLYKITGARNIAVIVPVHNRTEDGLGDIIGLLSNVILIKVNVGLNCTIADFVESCRSIIIEAMDHQQYPFDKLLQTWINRGGSIRQLMSSFFGYHYNQCEYIFDEAILKLYIPHKTKENMPLSASIFETPSNLTLRLSSTVGTFDQNQLIMLMHQYFSLLERIIKSNNNDLIESVIKDI